MSEKSNACFRKKIQEYVEFFAPIFLICLLCSWYIAYYWNARLFINRTTTLKPTIKKWLLDTEGCKIPLRHVNPDSFLYFRRYKPPCANKKPPLVISSSNPFVPSLHFFRNISQLYGDNVTCSYDALYRKDDFNTEIKKNVKRILDDIVPVDDEFVRVQCLDNNHNLVFEKFFSFIQRKPEIERKYRKIKEQQEIIINPEEKLNILFLVVDAVSRSHYLRHMMKTDEYLRKYVSMVDMIGFNKIKSSTFLLMIAMLTGELHERFNMTLNPSADSLPFIWKNFSAEGYRILFSEEMAHCGTFQHFPKGFIDQPTDYYFRPFTLVYEDSKLVDRRKFYFQKALTETEIILKWTGDFFDVFPSDPVFALTIIAQLSHTSLFTLHEADEVILNFFRDFNEDNHLNRTIVFFMSNHGFSYGAGRSSCIGRLESKLTFLFILYPPWFRSRYPNLISNLETNANRLITILDVYATLKDLLNFSKLNNQTCNFRASSMSLLRSVVPSNRTCADAQISKQFCACEDTKLTIDDIQVKRTAYTLLTLINNYTSDYRARFSFFRLDKITCFAVGEAMSESVSHYYQITIKVSPGDGLFEGIVYPSKVKNGYFADPNIERINEYGHQADCIHVKFLKPFCYCRIQMLWMG